MGSGYNFVGENARPGGGQTDRTCVIKRGWYKVKFVLYGLTYLSESWQRRRVSRPSRNPEKSHLGV